MKRTNITLGQVVEYVMFMTLLCIVAWGAWKAFFN